MLSSVNAMPSIVDLEMDNKGIFFDRSLIEKVLFMMVWILCMMKSMEPNIIANGVIGICSHAVRRGKSICSQAVR